jgi:hypothetical protein
MAADLTSAERHMSMRGQLCHEVFQRGVVREDDNQSQDTCAMGGAPQQNICSHLIDANKSNIWGQIAGVSPS